jgi:hypothetical protein
MLQHFPRLPNLVPSRGTAATRLLCQKLFLAQGWTFEGKFPNLPKDSLNPLLSATPDFAKRRDPRTGRNPRTGAAVPVASKAVPYFKPGKELRERVDLKNGAD